MCEAPLFIHGSGVVQLFHDREKDQRRSSVDIRTRQLVIALEVEYEALRK